MHASNCHMWGFPRSWPADRSSKPPQANSSWQSHGKGTGVPHSSMHLPSDLPSHNLLANEGWCYGGRWPHTARGEDSAHLHNILDSSLLLCTFTTKNSLILFTTREQLILSLSGPLMNNLSPSARCLSSGNLPKMEPFRRVHF